MGKRRSNGLTVKDIEAATYTAKDGKRQVLWDNAPRGLGLRVFPSGTKTFVVSYRTEGGTKRLHTIGTYGSPWTLDTARTQAKTLLLSVEKDQADPVAEKTQRRIEAATGTVEKMFAEYIKARRNDPKKPMKRADDLADLAKLHITPEFGSRPWQELRRSEVREWHEGMADMPSQANNALRALRAAYNWRLKADDEIATKRSDVRNPCWGVTLFDVKPRQVRLEMNQLPKLEAAIESETTDPYMKAFFRFLIATGCRRGEALSLKWEDVDLAQRSVTFRETKNTDDRAVPLSIEAAELLRALPRVDGNPYVFVGRIKGQPLVGIDKTWTDIRDKAGVPNLWMHDLRRTFGSWLGDAGYTSKQIGTVLGHRTDITSRVYMALGDQTKREAIDAHAALMREARKPKKKRKTKAKKAAKKSAKVIQFPRRAAR